jgi:AcrR family transcriptional regulator
MATSAERRAPLTRDRVLDAALRLVDEGGIESLSMRKLGQALGVEAMSLYNHVANKNDVITGILERVADEIERPSSGEAWDVSIRKSAISAHDALQRHPWACALMMTPEHVVPERIRYMESLLGRIRGAGFSPEQTYHAYHVLDAHIFGFSLWQAGHAAGAIAADPHELIQRFMKEFPPEEYPNVAQHGEQHLTEWPGKRTSAFELTLDLILDGLRRMRAAG